MVFKRVLLQARLEVHRFGITGFKKEQQRVFEQDRAIMLGARVSTSHREHIWWASQCVFICCTHFYYLFSTCLQPPKKDYVNYKLLQQQVKEKKQKAKEDVQPVRPLKQPPFWRQQHAMKSLKTRQITFIKALFKCRTLFKTVQMWNSYFYVYFAL